MKFGEKLRKKRTEAGYTQEALASRLGVTCRTLQNYERGLIYPKKRRVYVQLAELFQTDTDYWLAESAPEPQIQPGGTASEQAFRVKKMIRESDMTEAELDTFMRIVQEAYWDAKDQARKKPGNR